MGAIMKNLFFFIISILFVGSLSAQTTVDAKDILKDIEAGKAIKYENCAISGDLDFTILNEDESDRKSSKKDSWVDRLFSKNGSSNEIVTKVEVPISFTNCTFKDDVIAYYHDDFDEITYNVNFYEDVNFTGCNFERGSQFKYVKFMRGSDFAKSIFEEEALFKYAAFNEKVSFAGSKFYDEANFKYTDFDEYVDFTDCLFDRDADFKYTAFPYGVSFKNAVFERFANFKYANFDEPTDLDGVDFRDDVDFKYTEYSGNSFIRHLIKSRHD